MLWTDTPTHPIATPQDQATYSVEVAGLSPDPLAVVSSLHALAGTRRLVALNGSWLPTEAARTMILTADPVEVVETWDPQQAHEAMDVLDTDRPNCHGFAGAWLGIIGHAAGPGASDAATSTPVVSLGWFDHVLRHDGERWWAHGNSAAALRKALALTDEARAAPLGPAAVNTALSVPDAGAHMSAVEQAVTAIRAGEMVQTTICSRYRFHVKHPVQAWTDLTRALSPAYSALVTGPWGALLGSSPELYLRRCADHVRSAPIKGTAPLDDSEALRSSVKDVAENMMIVDLVRNDLSRVCRPGSVRTSDLLSVEPGAGVNHLVSTVSGALRPGIGESALISATFPPGSVTGAPKLRATQVSARLESAPRGAHTGAVGMSSPGWGSTWAVTIRSVEVDSAGEAELGIGSGITIGSTPADEWHECLLKAAPLLDVLGFAAPSPRPATSSHKGLADPDQGLIETLLVWDGRPVEIADHIERLRGSFVQAYGRQLVGDPGAVIAAAIVGREGTYRLRIRAVPERPVDLIEVDELREWPAPTALLAQSGLQAYTHPAPEHGSERHKYADRRWWERVEASEPAADAVVLIDAHGALLEGSRSSIVAVFGGSLLTPPTDGRILPGTARQQFVDLAVDAGFGVQLAPLRWDLVMQADGILLLNALRGAQWVRRLGRSGHPTIEWATPAPQALGLADALLRRWNS